MEFRYRAGVERDPYFISSSSSSDGYFASQALRAGFGIGRGGLLPPMTPPKEALMRELQKERIREELLSREIAQKRMLEEELRRELALERQMTMRRFQEERLLSMGVGRYFEPGIERVMMPFDSETRVGERPVPRYLEVRADERLTLLMPRYPEVRTDERLPFPIHPKAAVGKKVPKPFSKPEISPVKDIKPSNPISSGVKRKAANELPRPGRKEWSCVLCQVRTSSQEALKEHLRGKKHEAKEALLSADHKATPKKPNGSTSMAKEGDRPLQVRGTSAFGPVKKNRIEGKKQQPKTVWCNLCQVKCNSPAMMACHLGGKKHISQLEESKRCDEDGTAARPAEVVKEVTDQAARRKGRKRQKIMP